ncbi:hypothetical protein BJ742DRAFT_889299 [Cladochytrium replicatum]|nr:hypothetical protein BJ742DRAFT_889299 [Cladochytrium replicatum]
MRLKLHLVSAWCVVHFVTTAANAAIATTGPFASQKLYGSEKILLGLKALILRTSLGGHEAAEYIFKAYGFPFDTQLIPATFSTAGSLDLVENITLNQGGIATRGKYSLIVLSDGYLAYPNGSNYQSALSDAQWAQLYAYEARYGVRQVTLNDYPTIAYHGIQTYNGNGAGCCSTGVEQELYLNTTNAPLALAGIRSPSPSLSTTGLWHYPSTIVNYTKAAAVAHFRKNDAFKDDTVAAALIQHDNGRQQMSFFTSFGSWSQTSLLLGHIWFNWGTRGVYQGVRRLYLGLHIDDVFLPTDTDGPINSKTFGVGLYNDLNKQPAYRLSPTDVGNLITWQNRLNTRLPAGSNVRLEFAFNMNGAALISQPNLDTVINFDGGIENRDLNFKKPLGTGVTRWPDPIPANIGLNLQKLKLDPLFNYFAGNDNRLKQFYWVSHTFSHEELDTCSKYDAVNELKYNSDGATLLGLTGRSYYSIRTMVTPQITGVFNGDALAAMAEKGIIGVVGDNSRTNLVNPNGLWFPLYTTIESSNLAGTVIIPRSPTEVYFNCSTPEMNQILYDKMYLSYYGTSTNFTTNMKREANRILYKLLSLHQDPYMFHQANLRTSLRSVTIGTVSGTFSLVQQWTEHVVQKLNATVSWPVRSLKLDDLMDAFLARERRDACGLSSTLVLSNDGSTLLGVEVVSSKTCKGVITVPIASSAVKVDSEVERSIQRDQLGKEPFVVWMDNDASKAFSLTLSTPLKWGKSSLI